MIASTVRSVLIRTTKMYGAISLDEKSNASKQRMMMRDSFF